MNKITRTLTYLVIIVVVLIGLFFLKPKSPFVPHGILLPAKITRAPSDAKNIALYRDLPPQAMVLGRVNVQEHYKIPSQSIAKACINYAKQLSAKVGANGIVVTEIGYVKPGPGNPQAAVQFIFQGKAIYTKGGMQ